MNTKQCLEHPWITGIISPESPLEDTTVSDNTNSNNCEENMAESCDEMDEKSDSEKEKLDCRIKCSQSSNALVHIDQKDCENEKAVYGRKNSDESIPSKILKCNSNSNIIDECEKVHNTGVTVSCSQTECNVKESFGIDDVNSNLSTQAVL